MAGKAKTLGQLIDNMGRWITDLPPPRRESVVAPYRMHSALMDTIENADPGAFKNLQGFEDYMRGQQGRGAYRQVEADVVGLRDKAAKLYGEGRLNSKELLEELRRNNPLALEERVQTGNWARLRSQIDPQDVESVVSEGYLPKYITEDYMPDEWADGALNDRSDISVGMAPRYRSATILPEALPLGYNGTTAYDEVILRMPEPRAKIPQSKYPINVYSSEDHPVPGDALTHWAGGKDANRELGHIRAQVADRFSSADEVDAQLAPMRQRVEDLERLRLVGADNWKGFWDEPEDQVNKLLRDRIADRLSGVTDERNSLLDQMEKIAWQRDAPVQGRTYFIEEIQSDNLQNLQKALGRSNQAENWRDLFAKDERFLVKKAKDYREAADGMLRDAEQLGVAGAARQSYEDMARKGYELAEEADRELEALYQFAKEGASKPVSSSPLAKAGVWEGLAVRRSILGAVENGADEIAFTNGAIQSVRNGHSGAKADGDKVYYDEKMPNIIEKELKRLGMTKEEIKESRKFLPLGRRDVYDSQLPGSRTGESGWGAGYHAYRLPPRIVEGIKSGAIKVPIFGVGGLMAAEQMDANER